MKTEHYFALHGWSGDSGSFDPIRPHLPEQVHLVAPDQPGFGARPGPQAWDFDAYTQPLLEDLEALKWPKCTLVGNCAGAVVALELALRQPQRFDRLVLIDPFAFVPWYFRWLTHPILGRLFYWSTFANPMGRWLTNTALRSKRTEDTSLVEGFEAARHQAAFSYLTMLCRGADARRYAGVRVPVTLPFGSKTFSAVKRSVDIYQSLWPQAEAFMLEGAGHLPIQEATTQLAAYVLGEGHEHAHSQSGDLSDATGERTHRPAIGYHPSLGAKV